MKKISLIAALLFLGLAGCDSTSKGDSYFALMFAKENTTKTLKASFWRIQGTVTGTLKTSDAGTAIVVSSEIERGRMEFALLDPDGAEVAKIETNHLDTIRGLCPRTKYKVRATGQRAKGKFEAKVI